MWQSLCMFTINYKSRWEPLRPVDEWRIVLEGSSADLEAYGRNKAISVKDSLSYQ